MQDRAAVTMREAQTIEQLRERYEALKNKRIVAETNRQNAEKSLLELKDEARAQFGTDDPEKLSKMLEEMVAENEKKRSEYQASLDKIEADLSEVERTYKEAVEAS